MSSENSSIFLSVIYLEKNCTTAFEMKSTTISPSSSAGVSGRCKKAKSAVIKRVIAFDVAMASDATNNENSGIMAVMPTPPNIPAANPKTIISKNRQRYRRNVRNIRRTTPKILRKLIMRGWHGTQWFFEARFQNQSLLQIQIPALLSTRQVVAAAGHQ